MDIVNIGMVIIKSGILIIGGVIGSKFIKRGIYRIFKVAELMQEVTTSNNSELQTRVTIIKHLVNACQYLLWCVIIVSILSVLRLEGFVQVLAAVSVAASFLIRDFVIDVIMGLFVLGEKQFKVGDEITLQDRRGIVTKVGLRTVQIKLPGGDQLICSNRLITSVVVHYEPSNGD